MPVALGGVDQPVSAGLFKCSCVRTLGFDRHDDVSRTHSGAKRISWEQSQNLWRGPVVGFMSNDLPTNRRNGDMA